MHGYLAEQKSTDTGHNFICTRAPPSTLPSAQSLINTPAIAVSGGSLNGSPPLSSPAVLSALLLTTPSSAVWSAGSECASAAAPATEDDPSAVLEEVFRLCSAAARCLRSRELNFVPSGCLRTASISSRVNHRASAGKARVVCKQLLPVHDGHTV